MKNHYFCVPLEAKEEAKWSQKSISIAIGKLLAALWGEKCNVDSRVAEFGGPGAPRRKRTPSPQPGRGLDKMQILDGSSTGVFNSGLAESRVPLYLGDGDMSKGPNTPVTVRQGARWRIQGAKAIPPTPFLHWADEPQQYSSHLTI